MKLSIVIPVYNEEKTITQVLARVSKVSIPGIEQEVIVVDDGSTDTSNFKVQQTTYKGIKLLSHKQNMGKGAAVRTGIKHAKGEYIIIQDADLEYNPKDISKLIEPIQQNKAHVVYGTRLRRPPNFSRDERLHIF